MAIGNPGDVVTFAISGVTNAGVVIGGGPKDPGYPDTTHNVVAYDFTLPSSGQMKWAREFTTSSVTVASVVTDA